MKLLLVLSGTSQSRFYSLILPLSMGSRNIFCKSFLFDALLPCISRYDLLISHKEELGQLITLEQGKPLKEAIGEVYDADFYKMEI